MIIESHEGSPFISIKTDSGLVLIDLLVDDVAAKEYAVGYLRLPRVLGTRPIDILKEEKTSKLSGFDATILAVLNANPTIKAHFHEKPTTEDTADFYIKLIEYFLKNPNVYEIPTMKRD
ncbi:hypothetical protein KBD71_05665 [Candidatus Woesebacteria bacterium]|nr:hypothetical protein [Candidatus Woesebacteria bacterium]